jgi:hypothetical protein
MRGEIFGDIVGRPRVVKFYFFIIWLLYNHK